MSAQDQINANDIKYIKDAVCRIEAQVEKTNGRVTSLEKWKYGFVCAIGALAATKWPILTSLLTYVAP